jgi:putative transposase
MEAVAQLRCRQKVSLRQALSLLELSRATYYRYMKSPVPKARSPRSPKAELTPTEKGAVLDCALANPLMGYKRLTWSLQNDFAVGIRPHEVAKLLKEEGLMGPRLSVPLELKRPAEPDHPNQVWHIDLMYVRILGRWTYLVDVVDAYSRYLVHWTLNETMEAETVTLTVQEALERHRPEKPPAIVHDSGSQFLSREWRKFVQHHGIPSIRTRIAHPESNGRVERIHRTHRTEALIQTSAWTIERTRQEMEKWIDFYNHRRPHCALQGLPPVVYYLGDPEAAIAQREHFVKAAAEARTNEYRLQQRKAA